MENFKIDDLVQVFEHDKNDWSKTYRIYKINSPTDKDFIGYCSSTSYWMKSLCGEWQRTWYAENYMRKVIK